VMARFVRGMIRRSSWSGRRRLWVGRAVVRFGIGMRGEGQEEALIRLSAPSPIPLRETGEGQSGCIELNDYRLPPFASWQMGEGPEGG
jgi:hypothetical protein